MKNFKCDQMVSFRLDGNWAGSGFVQVINEHSVEVRLLTDCKEFPEGSMLIVDHSEIIDVPIYRATASKSTVYLVEGHIVERGEGEQIKLIRGSYRRSKSNGNGVPLESGIFPIGLFDANSYKMELTDLKSI